MVLESDVKVTDRTSMTGWYKSSDRSKHPHPKKIRVECSLDEDVIQWLEEQTGEDEKYQMYINYYLRKIMENAL